MTIFDGLLGETREYLAGFGEPVASFASGVNWTMPARPLAAIALPCTRYLRRCADMAALPARNLAKALAEHAGVLRWGQTYTAADFGPHFIENYGWAELFGTRGHFGNDAVAGGFLVLGPRTTYPDHHHIAEEIYIPLTGGTEWSKGDGSFVKRGGAEVIHHPSNVSHAMRTGEDPLLALYLWRGGPLDQKSVIVG